MTALEPIAGPSVWHGGELMQRDDWIVTLDEQEIAELEAAASATLDRELTALARDDLPLPRLDVRLNEMRAAVVEGCGFALMRGLPVDRWSRELAARAFWAIGARIGMPVCQNPLGHLLGHVKDLGVDAWAPNKRGYQSSAELPFHTDIGAEIVGLFCLVPARKGGLSSIVSAGAVWNRILDRRPDAAKVLAEPFLIDRRGEEVDGQLPWYKMPVFMQAADERMTVNLVRRFIDSCTRHEGAPELTRAQVEALDLLELTAAEPDLRLDMDFQPGDIQWIDNLAVLHTRTAYEELPGRNRHLYRIWLAVPDGRAVPEPFFRRHGRDPATGRPLGLQLPAHVTPTAPLDALEAAAAA